MGLFGGDTIIGLDLGSSSIKAVGIQAAGDGWRVTGAAAVPTPRGAVAEGLVADAAALLPALRQLLTREGWRGAEIAAAINYTAAVTVRRMPLPVMAPELLRKQVQFRPDQFGVNGGKDYVTDFEILARQGAGEGAQMDTVFVSAPRVPVTSRVAALEGAGLDVLAIDVEPLALMRSLVESNPGQCSRPGATAILDLGAAHTDVTIARGTSYVFTRPIPFGGDGFTEVIRQALQCEPGEAETLKTGVDLHWLLEGPGGQAAAPAYKATAAIKSVLDDLLKEVRNSLLYYHAQLPDEEPEGMVDTILLAGGTARMPGLAEYVQAAFSLQVERADFTRGFAYPVAGGDSGLTPETSPLFSLALGLAIKEPLDRRRNAQAAARGKMRAPRGAAAPAAPPAPASGPAE